MLLLRLEVTHTPAKATAGSHRRRGSTGWGQCCYRGGWGGHRWDHQCGRCLVGECWECRAFIALLKTGTWIHEINKMQGSRRVQYEPVMRKCHESRKTNSVIWTWVPFKTYKTKEKKSMDPSLNSKLRRLPDGCEESHTRSPGNPGRRQVRSDAVPVQVPAEGGGQQARCWAALSLHLHSGMGAWGTRQVRWKMRDGGETVRCEHVPAHPWVACADYSSVD